MRDQFLYLVKKLIFCQEISITKQRTFHPQSKGNIQLYWRNVNVYI